jgi:hypothetical protein
MGVMVASLVAGCGKKPDARDAKIVKLESRVAELERKIDIVDSVSAGLAGLQADSVKQGEIMQAAIKLIEENQESEKVVKAQIEILANSLTNQKPRAAVQYVPQPAVRPVQQLKSGVPVVIYNQIAADAARRYPTDFEMQNYIIKGQVEAYRKLHP